MAVVDRNRNKAKQPHGRSGWCFGCDRELVNDGEKCAYCGRLQGPLRFKSGKQSPMISDYNEDLQ